MSGVSGPENDQSPSSPTKQPVETFQGASPNSVSSVPASEKAPETMLTDTLVLPDAPAPADTLAARPAAPQTATQEMAVLGSADGGTESATESQASTVAPTVSVSESGTPTAPVVPPVGSAPIIAAPADTPAATDAAPPTGTTKPISEPSASASPALDTPAVSVGEPVQAPSTVLPTPAEPVPAASMATPPAAASVETLATAKEETPTTPDAAPMTGSGVPPAATAPSSPPPTQPPMVQPPTPPATMVAPPGIGPSPFTSPAPARLGLIRDTADAGTGVEVRTCPLCGSRVREGELACSFCGHVLSQQGKTAKFDEETEVSGKKSWPTGEVLTTEQKPITFEIEGKQLTLMIAESITVGRNSDIPGDALPDVDLGLYGASELGVSRRHIRIRRKGILLYVADLNSTNGTLSLIHI